MRGHVRSTMREKEVDGGSRWRNMRTRERGRVKGKHKGSLCRKGIEVLCILSDIAERKYYASRARQTIEQQGCMALSDGFLLRKPYISDRFFSGECMWTNPEWYLRSAREKDLRVALRVRGRSTARVRARARAWCNHLPGKVDLSSGFPFAWNAVIKDERGCCRIKDGIVDAPLRQRRTAVAESSREC